MKMNNAALLLSAAMLTPIAAGQASAAELITNGGFETGSFAGWTVVTQTGSRGTFSISNPGANAPISGDPTAPNSTGGSFYALTTQDGATADALGQAFTVAAGTTALNLSFQMFVNNRAGQVVTGSQGLDFTGGDNQHVRVDILRAGADLLSTDVDDVVANLFIGGSDTAGPNPYLTYNYDLLPLVGTGSYQLRFGEVDNLNFHSFGIDNVSINATPATGAVPEPATWAMMLVGFGGIGFAMRRKSKVTTIVAYA